jgi:hypothetical protein
LIQAGVYSLIKLSKEAFVTKNEAVIAYFKPLCDLCIFAKVPGLKGTQSLAEGAPVKIRVLAPKHLKFDNSSLISNYSYTTLTQPTKFVQTTNSSRLIS